VAAGPVAFMQVFDQSTEVIKHGGRRRVDHPDILTLSMLLPAARCRAY
jgi:ribonucleotide reductase alpha subunit